MLDTGAEGPGHWRRTLQKVWGDGDEQVGFDLPPIDGSLLELIV